MGQSPTCLETTQQLATFLIQSRKKLEQDSVMELQKSPKSLANIRVDKSKKKKKKKMVYPTDVHVWDALKEMHF